MRPQQAQIRRSLYPTYIGMWRQWLAAFVGIKVGLVGAGNPGLGNLRHNHVDRRRSLPLAKLAPLGRIPGVALVSLQKGAGVAQSRPPPSGMLLQDWTDELRDFVDTAALVCALDLVVTVDTSVAHLAGALGRPVWLLNRHDSDWRWLLNREDSPWYPTLRQFRQPSPGDWETVIAMVEVELHRMAAGSPEEALFEHANACHLRGDYPAAAASYRQVLALKPDHVGAHANLGLTLSAMGWQGEAERHMRRAIALAPHSPLLQDRLATVLQAQFRV